MEVLNRVEEAVVEDETWVLDGRCRDGGCDASEDSEQDGVHHSNE